jgi:hypothetical protein
MAWQVNIRTSIIFYKNVVPFVIATSVLPYGRPLTYAWSLGHTYFYFILLSDISSFFSSDYAKARLPYLFSKQEKQFWYSKVCTKTARWDSLKSNNNLENNTTSRPLFQWLKQPSPRPCFFPSISFILDLLSNHYKIMALITLVEKGASVQIFSTGFFMNRY